MKVFKKLLIYGTFILSPFTQFSKFYFFLYSNCNVEDSLSLCTAYFTSFFKLFIYRMTISVYFKSVSSDVFV